MKKIFFSLVILVSFGFLWFKAGEFSKTKINQVEVDTSKSVNYKKTILRFALVADSENDNEDLKKALDQAKGSGVNFVIGLGDWSAVGARSDLIAAKKVFDDSSLKYYLTPGDHDLWDSRNRGEDGLLNYREVFGEPSQSFVQNGIYFEIVDNSDIYKGIDQNEWQLLSQSLSNRGPVSSFPPAPSLNSGQAVLSVYPERSRRAVGNLSRIATPRLTFVFSHKTPFHPQSSHVMGSENEQVAEQAKKYMELLEENRVDGFFAGDLHFFAEYKSPTQAVRITTIGAVSNDRNFQGPRYGVVTVYDDYSWDVEDLEIR